MNEALYYKEMKARIGPKDIHKKQRPFLYYCYLKYNLTKDLFYCQTRIVGNIIYLLVQNIHHLPPLWNHMMFCT